MDKFVLIDGNAILHRAYHALPPFTHDGKPVGAVFGFTSMLLKVIADLKPAYIVVAFDRPKPTFRQELYAGYQAGRPAMEDDLASQVIGVHQIVEALTIPIYEIDGYEADDIIGTIAKQVVEGTVEDRKLKVVVEGRRSKVERKKINPRSSNFKEPSSMIDLSSSTIEVFIVSGDRDLLQLVNSHVRMYAPIKGLTEVKLFDGAAVKEKYGIEPHQIVDMKALTGDTSDQYPGVAGIGPKTASVLLQKYGTLESLYENLGEVSERVRNALAQGAESAALAKKLATIVTDAPVRIKLETCQFRVKDRGRAIETFRSFGFRTLTERLIALLDGKPIDVPAPIKAKPSKLKIAQPKQKDDSQLRLV